MKSHRFARFLKGHFESPTTLNRIKSTYWPSSMVRNQSGPFSDAARDPCQPEFDIDHDRSARVTARPQTAPPVGTVHCDPSRKEYEPVLWVTRVFTRYPKSIMC